jgi:uncharacterized cupin superfamily protein
VIDGEEGLRSGDSAGFAAGVPDGHHIHNRSNRQAVLLEIGSRRPETDACGYSDNAVMVEPGPEGSSVRPRTAMTVSVTANPLAADRADGAPGIGTEGPQWVRQVPAAR